VDYGFHGVLPLNYTPFCVLVLFDVKELRFRGYVGGICRVRVVDTVAAVS
jgi:hypothetical protein